MLTCIPIHGADRALITLLQSEVSEGCSERREVEIEQGDSKEEGDTIADSLADRAKNGHCGVSDICGDGHLASYYTKSTVPMQ